MKAYNIWHIQLVLFKLNIEKKNLSKKIIKKNYKKVTSTRITMV